MRRIINLTLIFSIFKPKTITKMLKEFFKYEYFLSGYVKMCPCLFVLWKSLLIIYVIL